MYWVLEGRHDDHVDWALRQVHWLHANGRMFAERDHVHTLMYRLEGRTGTDGGVPAELALDHPFGGLVATLVRPDAGTTGDELVAGVGADLSLAFSPIPLDPDAPVSQQGLEGIERCRLLLSFTSGPPADGWETHRQVCDGLPGEVLWSSAFVPTVPGTDRYADELW